MAYNITEWKVTENEELLAHLDDEALGKGRKVHLDVGDKSPASAQYQVHEILKSAEFYDEYGYGHLRDELSVGIDTKEGTVVVYPREKHRRGGASVAAPKGYAITPHKALKRFIEGPSELDILEFRIPDGFQEPMEHGHSEKELFEMTAREHGVDITWTDVKVVDGVPTATVVARQVGSSTTEEEQESPFDLL